VHVDDLQVTGRDPGGGVRAHRHDEAGVAQSPGTRRRSGGRRRLVTALPARGEVWWCELAEIGRRPVVVLSRDAAIPRLRRTLIGPCTTTIRGIPSEVLLEPGEDPVPRTAVVNLDSVESVSLGTLVEPLGRLSDERMRQICDALEIAVACEA
jgi:mRNA interferase MazF